MFSSSCEIVQGVQIVRGAEIDCPKIFGAEEVRGFVSLSHYDCPKSLVSTS